MFNFIFKKPGEGELSKKHHLVRKAILLFLVLVLMLVSFGAGMYITGKNKLVAALANKESVYLGKVTGKYTQDTGGRLSQDIDFNLYWEVWDALKAKYVDKDKINEKKMFYGSLSGLAASLGDPYTVFFDPKDSQTFSNDLSGTFEGIGAEVGLRDDVITIIAPLAGMPAEKAGIKAGDKVLAINGSSTVNMTIDAAVEKIRGPKGTKVVLTIFRQGFKETKDISIIRDVIYVKSVQTVLRPDKIFVITISNFNEDTADLFKSAAQQAVKDNPKGLIIDLRNNPGGFLDSAVSLASEWVKSGKPVVSEKSTDPSENNEYDSSGIQHLNNFPTVVLVNGGSASASEILAGALKDYNLAKIVGEKTYGKGSVQVLQTLSDGSMLKVTVAKWFTPNGYSINEQGIVPDVIATTTEAAINAGADPQMDKAVEILKSKF
ncbi:MAG: S41 family peptidase [Patescibacteria group bacterium]|nr:S41 family peptidase [Patescibacteria group bacterium]